MKRALSGLRRSSLSHLPDALLVEILNRVNDLAGVIRFGSVNRRLHRLHFLVTRLQVREEAGSGEDRLLCFLASHAHRGGFLRELVVCLNSESEDDYLVDKPHWIVPVASTLHSLELDVQVMLDDIPELPAIDMISRCTMLVKLQIGGNSVCVNSRHLKKVLASCTRLRFLTIDYIYNAQDVLELRSSSLQQVHLGGFPGLSVALETPALTDLSIRAEALNIRSHALKKLNIKLNKESRYRHPSIDISPPLANLECLWLEKEFWVKEMKDVLEMIQGGCVDVLQLGDPEDDYLQHPVNLGTLLEPLTRLRSLEVSCRFMQSLARRTVRNEGDALTRLGVDEVVVGVNALMNYSGCTSFDAKEHYRHVGDLMLVLRSFLSSTSLRKLVIDCSTLEHYMSPEEIVIGCRGALMSLVQSLKNEFPGVVSLRRYRPWWAPNKRAATAS